jgi:hypothetical protein
MNSLEDEIRDALRSEAGRLREVRPLRLEPAPQRLRPVTAPRRARRLGAWVAPVTAAAAVITLAVSLVVARSAQPGPGAPVPNRSASPTATAVAVQVPQYDVGLDGENIDDNSPGLVISDSLTGRKLATVQAPKGTEFFGFAPAAAADDRTFIAGATVIRRPPFPPYPTTGPVAWYLIRFSPGSAHPARMTKLPIPASVRDLPALTTALSGDGRYLAVAFGSAGTTRQELRVYSVATGRLMHTWHMPDYQTFKAMKAIAALNWINGDETVAFTLSWNEDSDAQVRTLALSAGGSELLPASHAVWSQHVPIPPHGIITNSTPLPCRTPFLTTNGQAVVCANRSYSAKDKAITIQWLAYPIATPATAHVVGRLRVPVADGPSGMEVEWADPSGNVVIGYWMSMIVGPIKHGEGSMTMNSYIGVASNGGFSPLRYGSSAGGDILAF